MHHILVFGFLLLNSIVQNPLTHVIKLEDKFVKRDFNISANDSHLESLTIDNVHFRKNVSISVSHNREVVDFTITNNNMTSKTGIIEIDFLNNHAIKPNNNSRYPENSILFADNDIASNQFWFIIENNSNVDILMENNIIKKGGDFGRTLFINNTINELVMYENDMRKHFMLFENLEIKNLIIAENVFSNNVIDCVNVTVENYYVEWGAEVSEECTKMLETARKISTKEVNSILQKHYYTTTHNGTEDMSEETTDEPEIPTPQTLTTTTLLTSPSTSTDVTQKPFSKLDASILFFLLLDVILMIILTVLYVSYRLSKSASTEDLIPLV
ncbi:hypothetical protein [Carp edema virus]|nr:hypothetical protein [Carp edema virus]